MSSIDKIFHAENEHNSIVDKANREYEKKLNRLNKEISLKQKNEMDSIDKEVKSERTKQIAILEKELQDLEFQTEVDSKNIREKAKINRAVDYVMEKIKNV